MELTEEQFEHLGIAYLAANDGYNKQTELPSFRVLGVLPEDESLYVYLDSPTRLRIAMSGGTKTVDGVKTRPVDNHTLSIKIEHCITPVDVINALNRKVYQMVDDMLDNPTRTT